MAYSGDMQLLLDRTKRFVKERDWEQFHNPKDMAISLSLEAAEVLEHFQWKNTDEVAAHLEANKEKVANELADVLYWVLLMSDRLEIDLVESFNQKMDTNEIKYPIAKAKGKHTKYSELG